MFCLSPPAAAGRSCAPACLVRWASWSCRLSPPVLVVPLELQLGKVCLTLVLRPQAEVLIGIFPLFLQIICSLAHSLRANGQLLQAQGDTASGGDSFGGQLLQAQGDTASGEDISGGQLLQAQGDTASGEDSSGGQLLHCRNMDTSQKDFPQVWQ